MTNTTTTATTTKIIVIGTVVPIISDAADWEDSLETQMESLFASVQRKRERREREREMDGQRAHL